MTKETKIGLLVGLAFIIVFAVILSEKGPSARNTSLPAFTLVDSAKNVGPSSPSPQPLNNAGRLPIDSQLPPIVQPAIGVNPRLPMREEEVIQPIQVAEGELPPLPESVVSLINGTLPVEQAAETAVAMGHSTSAQPPAPELPTQSPSPVTEETQPPTQTLLASGESTTPTVLPASAQTKFLTIKTIHTVEKGESLGKIAAKYYERSTPARVEAIYEANRDALDGLHYVKAGQQLKIPDLGSASSSFEPAPDFALNDSPTSPEPALRLVQPKDNAIRIPIPISEAPTGDSNDSAGRRSSVPGRELASARPQDSTAVRLVESKPSSFRVYEVKPSDTLSGIARRELGSERYHTEIYKLNKDILANKNTIKPGMKLRLPAPSASAPEPRTAISSSGLGSGD